MSELLVAARLWSTGSPIDLDSVPEVRTKALAPDYCRHLTAIPCPLQ